MTKLLREPVVQACWFKEWVSSAFRMDNVLRTNFMRHLAFVHLSFFGDLLCIVACDGVDCYALAGEIQSIDFPLNSELKWMKGRIRGKRILSAALLSCITYLYYALRAGPHCLCHLACV